MPEPVIRELRTEMIRLQARIDQIAAAAHDRAEEIADPPRPARGTAVTQRREPDALPAEPADVGARGRTLRTGFGVALSFILRP